jgi:Ca-activated chloride channel family protein
MIEWVWPFVFLAAPMPLLARWLLPATGGQQDAVRAPFFEQWQQITETQTRVLTSGGWLPTLAMWLIWILLLTAAARPVWIGEAIEIPQSGRDLMMAVDISGSMLTRDMKVGNELVERIISVKQVGAEFIAKRKGDRLGLILFGSKGYVQSPLSFDTSTVTRFLMEAQIGFAGKETAIGDAIGLAVKRLKERPAESRVLILLTDGQDNASSVEPEDAAKLAASLDIRIYTIGIGADEMATRGIFGSSFGSRMVNPSADLDEDTLQQIAAVTGGKYFRARNPQELASIYSMLDELEPVEREVSLYRPRQALGYLPLAAALVLSFILALYSLRHFLFSRLQQRRDASIESTSGGHA